MVRWIDHPDACYELFRRALYDEDTEALTVVLKLYDRQLQNWVTTHAYYWHTDGSVDDFISIAVTKFYFKLKGSSFSNFSSVSAILKYLKLCVNSAIMQEYRKINRIITQSNEVLERKLITTSPVSKRQDFRELWDYLCTIFEQPIDQLLMRCAFIYNMKPSEIMTTYPNYWETAREVSIDLYRIRKKLRNDSSLQEWMSISVK